MGKRYYCSYCDVSFPDSREGRKKHNSGLVHQKLKNSHYKQFDDARTRLREELQKGPCRKFLQGGEGACKFGRQECKFSHLDDSQIAQLRHQAYEEEMQNTCSVKLPSQLLMVSAKCNNSTNATTTAMNEPTAQEFARRVHELLLLQETNK